MIKVLLIILVLLFIVYVIFGLSKEIYIRRDTITTNKITKDIKFMVISDLHGFMFGNNYDVISDIIEKEEPDFIVMPGDIFDNTDKIVNSYDFIKVINKYKTYYSLGNHEYRIEELPQVIDYVKGQGIYFLDNKKEAYNDEVDIIGIKDPKREEVDEEEMLDVINELKDDKKYTILLSHRPNYINLYEKSDVDLVISGHAHGGQWCIPKSNKGIYAPDQGLFPKYTCGIHTKGNSLCYISKGLATGRVYLPRLYNPSEVGIITLSAVKN